MQRKKYIILKYDSPPTYSNTCRIHIWIFFNTSMLVLILLRLFARCARPDELAWIFLFFFFRIFFTILYNFRFVVRLHTPKTFSFIVFACATAKSYLSFGYFCRRSFENLPIEEHSYDCICVVVAAAACSLKEICSQKKKRKKVARCRCTIVIAKEKNIGFRSLLIHFRFAFYSKKKKEKYIYMCVLFYFLILIHYVHTFREVFLKKFYSRMRPTA